MIPFTSMHEFIRFLATPAGRLLLLLPILVLLLLGFHFRGKLTRPWRFAWYTLAFTAVVCFGMRGVWIAWANVLDPRDLDFQSFWLYGRAIANGLSPYEPANLRNLAQVLSPRPGFEEMLFCFYPPPSLFLYAPLGWFTLQGACLLWYSMHGAILLLDMYLLWRLFQQQNGLAGLLLVAALLLMLRSTLSTLYFGQVNFLLLLMLLLFWRHRASARCGVWLGLGILVKPVLLFVSLYLLVSSQRWRAVLVMAGTLAIAFLLAVGVFGPTMVLGYFTDNPILHDLPDHLYFQPINQSLLATILRFTEYDFSETSPYGQPLFVLLGILLTGITVWRVSRSRGSEEDWALGLLVAFALLIFPKTLDHYSVLLIVPLLILWANRTSVWGGIWTTIAVIALSIAMVGTENSFFAMAAIWSVFAALGGIRRPTRETVKASFPSVRFGTFVPSPHESS